VCMGNHFPRINIASNSSIVIWNQVGRPWLHWSARSVCLAQDGVHLGQAQLPVGAHGGKICRNLAKLFEQLADLRMQFV